jgi:hypothetical protein
LTTGRYQTLQVLSQAVQAAIYFAILKDLWFATEEQKQPNRTNIFWPHLVQLIQSAKNVLQDWPFFSFVANLKVIKILK